MSAKHNEPAEKPASAAERLFHRWNWKLARLVQNVLLTVLVVWILWRVVPGFVGFVQGPNFAPILWQMLLLAGYLFLFIGLQLGFIYFVLARTRIHWVRPTRTSIYFQHYVGNPDAVAAASRVVSLLSGIKQARRGGALLRGLLLVGPPGVGKRYLAQAIASEAGLPIGYLSGTSLAASRIGLGQIKVAMLYRKARKLAREYGACLLVIDNINALNENTSVLHELLLQIAPPFRRKRWWQWLDLGSASMRGNSTPAVLTIATTSHPEGLQAALFKPGRFDRRITIGLPDAEGRRALITYYLEQIAHEPLPLERMVADTAGHAPALIRHVLNDAPVYAYMEGRRAIAYADFAQAHALYSANAAPAVREPFAAPTDETRRYIAYYQAGRTYMCLKLDRVGQTGMVSSFSLPTTHPSSLPDDSVVHKHLRTRVDLLADVQVALAGRAAEEVLTGTQTTAAVADLGQATEQAALLIERLAMDTQLAAEPGSQNHERVEALLQEQYAHVCDLLTNNRQAVTLLSEALMLCGELAERDIPALLAQIEARYPFVTPPTAQASPWMVARYLPASIRWESVHTPRRFAEPEPALPDDAEPEPDSSQE